MNVLLCTVGRRGYVADYFRAVAGVDHVFSTTDRASLEVGYSIGGLSTDGVDVVSPIRSDTYVGDILEVCSRRNISLLTSLFDLDVLVLSKHLDALVDEGVFPVLSSTAVCSTCISKLATERFLAGHGFLTPQSTRLADLRPNAATFPLVVKPDTGHASLNHWLITCAAELELLKGSPAAPGLIAQSYLPYPEFGLDVFNDQGGRTIACVVKRKIAMRAGETDQAVTVKDDALIEFGVALGEALGHLGPLDVDLMLTPDGPVVLDLNARLGGGYPLSHAAGVDFPGWMVAMARGEVPTSRLGNYREGLVMLKDVRPQFFEAGSLAARFTPAGRA
ncbi:MAG: ATP-grasp domain-containing protein [Pseudomonadales bacterium]